MNKDRSNTFWRIFILLKLCYWHFWKKKIENNDFLQIALKYVFKNIKFQVNIDNKHSVKTINLHNIFLVTMKTNIHYNENRYSVNFDVFSKLFDFISFFTIIKNILENS